MDCKVQPVKKQDMSGSAASFQRQKLEPYETLKSLEWIGLVGFNRQTIAENQHVEHPTKHPF
jgi:hypothetical protein